MSILVIFIRRLGQIECRSIVKSTETEKTENKEEFSAPPVFFAGAIIVVVVDFLLDSVVLFLPISSPKMLTMRDEGETCPLCAEEMDLTDMQLKPCKCGYDICVWCWNQIIDLAEAQNTEGRCPACRRPYDKERIVGATNCERVIPELFGEKKQKSQKGKSKVSSAETRKHLSSVRVIQRNLVYVVGLPMSLSDESMLEHRDYFGQYGKVLKVSITRSATGAQQTSSNNTFSVYITFAKEEEAVRCIQSVHNFILEGKLLRACFGTTKYCHAWLRNSSCSNPECFYLHEIGSEDDSFSKDEIISAYTRSRVPQVIANNLHRRSGSTLPPPVDDFCSSTSSTKIMGKNSSSSTMPHAKYLIPNDISTRSNVLPAAASWGSKATNPISSSTPCVQVSSKGSHHISNIFPETCDQSSAWNDDLTVPENQLGLVDSSSSQSVEPSKAFMGRHSHTIASNSSDVFGFSKQSSAWNDDQTSVERCEPIFSGRHGPLSRGFETMTNSLGESMHREQIVSAWDDDDDVIAVPSTSKINNDVPLIGRYNPAETMKSEPVKALVTSLSDSAFISETTTSNSSNPITLKKNPEDEEVDTPSNCTQGQAVSRTDINVPNVKSLCVNLSSVNFDEHRGSSASQILANSPTSKQSEHTTSTLLQKSSVVLPDTHASAELSGWTSELWKHFSPSIASKQSVVPEPEVGNAQSGRNFGVGHTSFPHSVVSTQSSFTENTSSRATDESGIYEGSSVDMGEKKIISDILSLDFDPWDTSITADNNLLRLLQNETKTITQKIPGSLDGQNSNQSRFSFARQENDSDVQKNLSLESETSQHGGNNNEHFGALQNPHWNTETHTDFNRARMASLSDKTSVVARANVSAPPGFSVPNRSPTAPPGFSPSQERLLQSHSSTPSGPNMPQNPYQLTTQLLNVSDDLELTDPAILVCKRSEFNTFSGSRYFPAEMNAPENDPLMRQNMPTLEAQLNSGKVGDGFLPRNDSYHKQFIGQNYSNISHLATHMPNMTSRNSIMSNSNQWHTWNEMQQNESSSLGPFENLRWLPDYSKYFFNNDEHKIGTTSGGVSGSLYGRYSGM